MKQTKIVASISDRRCDQDFIRKLFFAGMNVVRMNTAHASEEGIRTIVNNVRAVSPHIGILIDTKGPEVRTTGVKEPIHYNIGDVVKIFGYEGDREYRSHAGGSGAERRNSGCSQECQCSWRAHRSSCAYREGPQEYSLGHRA